MRSPPAPLYHLFRLAGRGRGSGAACLSMNRGYVWRHEGRWQTYAHHLGRGRRLVGRHHRPDGASASVRDPSLGHACGRGARDRDHAGARRAADRGDGGLWCRAGATLLATRPTAINLKWALDEMVAAVRNRPREERVAAAYRRAAEICDEDVAINQAIGRHGAKLIVAMAANKQPGAPMQVLTHCNAGWLATVDFGTALAPVYVAHDQGVALHVWVDETRPRNQGAALTAWELGQHGVPHTVIADNTGGHLMQHGMV